MIRTRRHYNTSSTVCLTENKKTAEWQLELGMRFNCRILWGSELSDAIPQDSYFLYLFTVNHLFFGYINLGHGFANKTRAQLLDVGVFPHLGNKPMGSLDAATVLCNDRLAFLGTAFQFLLLRLVACKHFGKPFAADFAVCVILVSFLTTASIFFRRSWTFSSSFLDTRKDLSISALDLFMTDSTLPCPTHPARFVCNI